MKQSSYNFDMLRLISISTLENLQGETESNQLLLMSEMIRLIIIGTLEKCIEICDQVAPLGCNESCGDHVCGQTIRYKLLNPLKGN